MTSSLRLLRKMLPVILLALPGVASAHVGAGIAAGLSHGVAHPFTGFDHLCAMIAVGLWAKQTGGRSVWALPVTFVCVMAAGGLIGMSGIEVPFVESSIVMSLLVLGVLIAAAVRLPLVASVATVGLFAFCHGYAHGAEMPHDASGLQYALGFMIATALLHLAGIGIATLLGKAGRPGWLRIAGASIALFGGALFLAN